MTTVHERINNNCDILDPVYRPSPNRRLPKPIGFELNLKSKCIPPPGLEDIRVQKINFDPKIGDKSQNISHHLEWRKPRSRLDLKHKRKSYKRANKPKIANKNKSPSNGSPSKNVSIKRDKRKNEIVRRNTQKRRGCKGKSKVISPSYRQKVTISSKWRALGTEGLRLRLPREPGLKGGVTISSKWRALGSERY